jgi:hypothetical protein
MKLNVRLTIWIAVFAASAGVAKYFVEGRGWAHIPITTLTGSILSGVTFVIGFVLSSLIKDYKEAEKLPLEIASSIKNLADDGEYFAAQLADFDDEPLREHLGRLCDLATNTITSSADPELDSALRSVLVCISSLDRAGAPPNHTVRMKTDVFAIRKAIERARYIRRIFNLPTAYTLVVTLAFVAMALLFITTADHRVGIAVATGMLAYLYAYLVRLIAVVENPFAKRRGDRMDDISLYLIREAAADLKSHRAKPTSTPAGLPRPHQP